MLIAIEGIDGSGKSTIANYLKEELEKEGFRVVVFKEPTNSIYGQKIRQSFNNRLDAHKELELFLLDRKHDVEKNILPALKKGYIIVMDRYYYSTIAYQGARGIDIDKIKKMNEKIAPKPDLVIILDVKPEIGIRRIKERGDKPNKFEDLEYLEKVRKIFLELKDDNIVIVDANKNIEFVKNEVLKAIKKFLKFKDTQNSHQA
ncbi:MAG TPA: dTMP kinase [Archaeoglobus veneficus]|nr:dTMP kinase [Archaeoglobus veneficus]